MFWSGFLFLAVGMYCIFVEPVVSVVVAQMIWILTLSLPFAIPPFGRWLNMSIDWDKNMFDWFRNYKKSEGSVAEDMSKIAKDMGKVVPFPELKAVPMFPDQVPYDDELPKQEPAKIFYRIGATDQHRVAFSMGQMEITMNKQGCQQMIDQLTVFMNQIKDENEH